METFLTSRRAPLWAGLILFLAALVAYLNSLTGPFVFDDRPAIVENPTIQHFGSAWSPPPGALPVSGRPVMNLSLALNYAISGKSTWSYHVLNLAIHILAGLTLFGIVRRTLDKVGTGGPPVRAAADPKVEADVRAASTEAGDPARPLLIAFAAALLWMVHPLQTESVTYISQRAESLMGLFYLVTLYGFIRYACAPPASAEASADKEAGPRVWAALSILACLFGMLTKEVMVSAPLIVLLYDRTFISGSFREAWQRRRTWYIALASTWVLLGLSVAMGGLTRGATSGFAIHESWWSYWLTQFEAVAHYLRLSIWPSPLVVYYEAFWATGLGPVLPYALVVMALAAATIWGVTRQPVEGPASPPCRGVAQRSRTTGRSRGECRAGARAFGFLGVWFFAILAPTSLVPNEIQMMAEHRMYLPLAAVAVAAVVGIFSVLGRTVALTVCLVAAIGLEAATLRRNEVYQSELSLWADTVAKRPNNSFAHNNLGEALYARGSFPEAIAQYREALRLNPGSAYSSINLGTALEHAGQLPEAIAIYQEALRRYPDWASIHNGLADALAHADRLAEAASQYRQALSIKPDYPQAENGLATVLFRTGKSSEAISHFQAALRMYPNFAEAWNNLGTALASQNRLPEAVPDFERAIQLKPDYSEAHISLGNAYFQANRLADAIHEYEEALRSSAGSAEIYDHYGILLAEAGRFSESEDQFKQALRLKPGDPEIQGNLQQVQAAEKSKSDGH